MTAKRIATIAEDLRQNRARVAFAEDILSKCVSSFCDQYRGSLRDMARKMGISVQYLCDIRHHRRKVSDNVVAKLARLK